jgi:hypothetical protein
MAMIEGYNLRGQVVEIYRDFEDFINYWNSTPIAKLEEILETHVDVLASSGERVKYYYVEEKESKERLNAFDKEFNITNDPINILDRTPSYFKIRNAKLEEMCDNSHQEYLDAASERGEHVDQYDDQYIAEMMREYYANGSDSDIDKDPTTPEQGLGGEDGGEYDEKGNSSHYQSQFMEFVRDQERKYGTIVAMIVCQSNVDKYNQRVGRKEGVPAEKDLTKRDWYFKAMTHFKKKAEHFKAGNCLPLEGRNRYVSLAEEVIDLFKIDVDQYGWSDDYVPLSTAIEK